LTWFVRTAGLRANIGKEIPGHANEVSTIRRNRWVKTLRDAEMMPAFGKRIAEVAQFPEVGEQTD